jgi:hypothetical protein
MVLALLPTAVTQVAGEASFCYLPAAWGCGLQHRIRVSCEPRKDNKRSPVGAGVVTAYLTMVCDQTTGCTRAKHHVSRPGE